MLSFSGTRALYLFAANQSGCGTNGKKRDYEFNPHVTIYDGASREFAVTLLERLQEEPMRFEFRVTELHQLESCRGQCSMLLRQSFDERLVEDVLGEQVRISEVDTLAPERRVSLVRFLASKLRGHCCMSGSYDFGTSSGSLGDDCGRQSDERREPQWRSAP